MTAVREGGCFCGAIRYRLTAEPLFVNCCHCHHCQRQTGSAFGLNLIIEADHVEFLSGEAQPVQVTTDDGRVKTTLRCPRCQVAIFSEPAHSRGLRFVRAGSLDDASGIVPGAHIFTRSKLPWVNLSDEVPSFETSYDRDALWPTTSLIRLGALSSVAD